MMVFPSIGVLGILHRYSKAEMNDLRLGLKTNPACLPGGRQCKCRQIETCKCGCLPLLDYNVYDHIGHGAARPSSPTLSIYERVREPINDQMRQSQFGTLKKYGTAKGRTTRRRYARSVSMNITNKSILSLSHVSK